MNNKSPLIANLHNESERTKKMKNEENWRKMKKNEEKENQIGAINHSQTLVILLLQNS